MDSDGGVVADGRGYAGNYVAGVDMRGVFYSYVHFVGTREALLARGLATNDTEFPKGRGGCIRRQTNERAGDGSYYWERVSALSDGRYRMTLDGYIAVQRDRAFRAFMANVLQEPKKPQRKRPGAAP